jgi:hypothetical protein
VARPWRLCERAWESLAGGMSRSWVVRHALRGLRACHPYLLSCDSGRWHGELGCGVDMMSCLESQRLFLVEVCHANPRRVFRQVLLQQASASISSRSQALAWERISAKLCFDSRAGRRSTLDAPPHVNPKCPASQILKIVTGPRKTPVANASGSKEHGGVAQTSLWMSGLQSNKRHERGGGGLE